MEATRFIKGDLPSLLGEIESRRKSLKSTPEKDILEFCECFLKEGYPHRTLEFSERLPPSEKASFLRGRAFISLGKYLEALEVLPKSSPLFEEAQRKHLQRISGRYDPVLMLTRSMENPLDPFDSEATLFFHPSLEICEDVGGGRGRGLVAKTQILEGKIILVAKAFAVESLHSDGSSESPLHGHSFDKLVNRIHRLLGVEPERLDEFFSLYAGQDANSLELRKRIEFVCNYNAFVTRCNSPGGGKLIKMGIFVKPALLNHDCLDFNCDWSFYGQFLLVRTIKTVEKGEELLIAYSQAAHGSPRRRQEYFHREFGFICQCRMCISEMRCESKEDRVMRNNLLEEFHQKVRSKEDIDPRLTLLEIENLIHKIPPEVAPILLPPLRAIGKIYLGEGEIDLALKVNRVAFQIMDRVDFRSVVAINFALNHVLCLGKTGETEKAASWLKYLKKMAKLFYGSVEVIEVICMLSIEEVEGFLKNCFLIKHLS